MKGISKPKTGKELLQDEKARFEYFAKKVEDGTFFSDKMLTYLASSEIKFSNKAGVVSIVDLPMLAVMAFARDQGQKDVKLEDGRVLESPRTIAFYGGMGLGKTTMIEKELPAFYKRVTGQDVIVKVVGMKGLEPPDITGVPTILDKKDETGKVVSKEAIFVKMRNLFPTEEETQGKPTILFFDEVNLSNLSVLEMMRELFNTGTIAEWNYRLPKNCRIIMAGNVPGEVPNLFVNETPAALTNRLLSYYVSLPSTQAELEAYLSNINLHPMIYGYLREGTTITVGKEEFSKLYCPQVMETTLNVVGSNATYTAQAWPSPRSWEEVSRILTQFEEMSAEFDGTVNYSSPAVMKMIEGAIGHVHAKDFMAFLKYNAYIVKPSEFFSKDDKQFNEACKKLIINQMGDTVSGQRHSKDLSRYITNLMWAQYSYLVMHYRKELSSIMKKGKDITNEDIAKIEFMTKRIVEHYVKKLENEEIGNLVNTNLIYYLMRSMAYARSKLSNDAEKLSKLTTVLERCKNDCLEAGKGLIKLREKLSDISIGGSDELK